MKVCFVCPYAYPLFNPSGPGRFGGAEVYAWLFARHLARHSEFDASFAVFDCGQPPHERIEGVELFVLPTPSPWSERFLEGVRPAVRRRGTFPWLKIKERSASLAWRLPLAGVAWAASRLRKEIYFRRFDVPQRRDAFAQAAADVYLTFGVHHITAEVVAYCRRAHRKSLLMIQSDYDLLAQYRPGSRVVNLYAEPGHICHYGLAHADLIVAQTVEQQALLRERFGRESTLVAQPIDLDQPSPAAPTDLPPRFVLWIGKADDYKRPYLCLELARLCPETPFVMIMNKAQPGVFQSVVDHVPPNVRLIEFVPFHLIEGYISRAALLVNTSAYEGFPHVFLQAGKYGVPVVALSVDPEGLLSRNGGGVFTHDNLPGMADVVQRLLADDAERRQLGANLQSYARCHHDAAAKADELARALRQDLGSS